MQNQEAFTYCWTDHKTNKLYVGYHKGQQDDGYICSQPLFLEQYNKRPEDFTRMILAEGTAEDCHALEIAILKAADAKHSNRFYNQSDGSSPSFVCKGHTEKSRKLMSDTRKGENGPFYGKHHTQISIEKMREAKKGKYAGKLNPMYGKKRTHTKKTRAQMKKSHTGKKQTEETKNKIGSRHKGKLVSSATRNKLKIANVGKHANKKARKNMSIAQLKYYASHDAPTKGKICITNGVANKTAFSVENIPEGWRRGKTRGLKK